MSFTALSVDIYPYKHPGPPPERFTQTKCNHIRLRFVWRVFAGKNQTKRYGFQCIECGDMGWKTASGRMCSLWVADRNCWDYFGEDFRDAVSIYDVLTFQLRQSRHDYYHRRREEFKNRSGEWWDWYNQYLICDAWKRMRQNVFERDKFKCAVCSGPAEQVHHLTYDRVGYEELEDLVSICKDCHDEVHR